MMAGWQVTTLLAGPISENLRHTPLSIFSFSTPWDVSRRFSFASWLTRSLCCAPIFSQPLLCIYRLLVENKVNNCEPCYQNLMQRYDFCRCAPWFWRKKLCRTLASSWTYRCRRQHRRLLFPVSTAHPFNRISTLKKTHNQINSLSKCQRLSAKTDLIGLETDSKTSASYKAIQNLPSTHDPFKNCKIYSQTCQCFYFRKLMKMRQRVHIPFCFVMENKHIQN